MKKDKPHKFKKPFFETKVGAIIKAGAPVLLKNVPVVGDIVENVTSQDGGQGKLDVQKLVSQTIRLILFGVCVYQYFKGNIPIDTLFTF